VPMGGWPQVERRYEPVGDGRYQAKGLIRAFRNPAGQPVTITAPWGEEQHQGPDCLFAAEYFPDDPERITADRYLIGAAEFAETYVPFEAAGGEAQMTETFTDYQAALEIIGDRAREAREAADLTQEQLGELIGASQPEVSRW